MTKNAGCKQLAAALLAPGVTVLRNMTPVADLDVMLDAARRDRRRGRRGSATTTLSIDATGAR